MQTLTDAINDIFSGHDAIRRATATVAWETDPKVPWRTAYRITGATRDVVQGAITGRMEYAERNDGAAEFTHPERCIEGWCSLGYVALPVSVSA